MSDDIHAAAAAMEQITAVMRDAWIPSYIAVERIVLEQGGSPALAVGVALALAQSQCSAMVAGIE